MEGEQLVALGFGPEAVSWAIVQTGGNLDAAYQFLIDSGFEPQPQAVPPPGPSGPQAPVPLEPWRGVSGSAPQTAPHLAPGTAPPVLQSGHQHQQLPPPLPPQLGPAVGGYYGSSMNSTSGLPNPPSTQPPPLSQQQPALLWPQNPPPAANLASNRQQGGLLSQPLQAPTIMPMSLTPPGMVQIAREQGVMFCVPEKVSHSRTSSILGR